jgi:predicted aspartyl protease
MLAWPVLFLAAAAASPPQPQPVAFDFIKSHIFVQAKLNGHRGLWLVDTGANTTVVSSRAASLGNCKPIRVRVKHDPYGITGFVSAEKLEVGGVSGPVRVVGVLPRLSDKILRTDGVFVDGIIGFDWLKNHKVRIDYRTRKLSLTPLGAASRPTRDQVVIPMEVTNGVPLVPVAINGGPVRKCLVDTGANVVNIRWEMARSSGIREDSPDVQPGPRVRGLSGAENTAAIVLRRLAMGKVVFANVPVSLYEDPHMPWLYGKIGNGLFESFKLTLDARNKQVILER